MKLPAGQRTAYQFPVYRWMGWLAVAGFAIGLTLMFFVSGMFGVPAPLAWAFLVILFTVGTLLLDRPKLLLVCMLFYFMLMPMNRLFGLVGLPLPNFIDELFFLPFIAVIVMNWIQRRQLKEAAVFPLAFCLVAALSWYVNGRPAPFTAVQVTLIMLKSYLIWYFCRLTCTFESERQLSRWVWAYLIYAAGQFLYNMLWQQGPWPNFHPDRSGGVFGPDSTGGAHFVGYLSVFALFLLAGWWITAGKKAGSRRRFWALGCAAVIAYNLIFMTDTKHALLIFPFAVVPFLLHPRLPARMRVGLLSAGALFMILAAGYLRWTTGQAEIGRTILRIQDTPKWEMLHAVTVDFPHLVPYPLLGAGPGRFASNQAVEGMAPLARRYIIPEMMALRRAKLVGGRGGGQSGGSMLGTPSSDFFTLMGEFGWAGAAAYYAFWGWIVLKLFRKSLQGPPGHLAPGVFLALSCCMIFFAFTTTIVSTATIPALAFPLWILVGRAWDMQVVGPGGGGPAAEAPVGNG